MIFLNHSLSTDEEQNRYDSLLLPAKVTLSYLDINNWYMESVITEAACVAEIHFKNKAQGFEDIGYQHKAVQLDLDLLSEGSVEKWKELKFNDFKETLQYKRKEFIETLRKGLKIAVGS